MKIIIGFSRNSDHKIGSELIQWWIGQDYSHVYARWHLDAQERDIVFHASHGTVHQIELNNFTRENTVVKEFILDLPDCLFKKFSQRCIDLCGVKYSRIELLQIFISDITNGKVKFEDQRGYICSELMAELLEDFFGARFEKPRFLLRPDDIMFYLLHNINKIQ